MKLSKSQKYAATSIAIVMLLYLAYQYYSAGNTPQRRTDAELMQFILLGVLLYIVAGVVIIARAYYSRSRFSGSDETSRSVEMNTLGALQAEGHKSIEIDVTVSAGELLALKRMPRRDFPLNFASMPLRVGDTIHLRASDSPKDPVTATVTKVDGYNQLVTLECADAGASRSR